MTVIGIDPGATTSIAVVTQDRRGGPWRLLFLRVVRVSTRKGETDTDRWLRWCDALRGDLTAAVTVAGVRPHVWIEAGTKMRDGVKRRSDTMAALGERRGAAIYAARQIDGATVERVPPGVWAHLIGVPVGKRAGGLHRIAEAGSVLNAAERLAELPMSVRVDAAEAVLIAAAGCVHRLGGR